MDKRELHLSLPDGMRAEAGRLAGLADLSLSQWIRQAIREKIARDAER
jgi:hypothetical protein